MHATVLSIPWWRLALSAVLVLLLVVIALRLRLGLAARIVTTTLRGTVQLIAVGYALGALFAIRDPALVLAALLLMLAVAARTAGSRGGGATGLSWLAGVALLAGTGIGVVFMTEAVIRPSPWYDPQYLIPFSGMLLGNSMNGASLAAERFQDELKSRRGEVEARLCLGFSGPESVHPLLGRSLRAAMIPTLNSFAVAGIVQLPGMMTGQVLAGVAPILAVRYQILIFILLMASTTVSTLLFLLLVRARYLTPAHQLRVYLLESAVAPSPRERRRS